MAKYLAIVTFTAEGLKGLMARGGTARTARLEASRKFLARADAQLDSYYFALGADDAYIVCATCRTTWQRRPRRSRRQPPAWWSTGWWRC